MNKEISINEVLQRGIKAHKEGQVKEAERYYTAILEAHPAHPDANHNLGVLYNGLGKIQKSLIFFKAALEANAHTPQYWLSYIET